MKVFLAGPIDVWWAENWETPEHIAYMEWRDYIWVRLVEAGHCVYLPHQAIKYLPHQAIKGAWDESMQAINDLAIEICDAFVYLAPPGVPAYGTEAETKHARALGKRIGWAPPGAHWQIDDLLVPLEDPYGKVHRKSYTQPS